MRFLFFILTICFSFSLFSQTDTWLKVRYDEEHAREWKAIEGDIIEIDGERYKVLSDIEVCNCAGSRVLDYYGSILTVETYLDLISSGIIRHKTQEKIQKSDPPHSKFGYK